MLKNDDTGSERGLPMAIVNFAVYHHYYSIFITGVILIFLLLTELISYHAKVAVDQVNLEPYQRRWQSITIVPFTVIARSKAVILGRQPLYTVLATSTAQEGISVLPPVFIPFLKCVCSSITLNLFFFQYSVFFIYSFFTLFNLYIHSFLSVSYWLFSFTQG